MDSELSPEACDSLMLAVRCIDDVTAMYGIDSPTLRMARLLVQRVIEGKEDKAIAAIRKHLAIPH